MLSFTKTIDLHDKALLPKSLEIGFHPFVRGLSASAPRIWDASLFAKPRCRYQPPRPNSDIRYKVSNWRVSPPLRRETAVTGHSFLAAAMTSGWPNYRFQDIQGPFGYWSEFVFPPYCSTRSKRTLFQGTPRCEPPPKRGLWNTGISSRLPSFQLLQSMFSRNSWRMFGQKSFPISPIDWTLIFPSTYLHIPPTHLPLTVIISIRNPTPCSIYVVSSGPLWPTFYHYKS